MKSKKRLNPDGSTNKIIVKSDRGAYYAFTPNQAANMIRELQAQLWSGMPIDNDFKEARR